MIADFFVGLLDGFIGAIPDGPRWLRRLVTVIYVVLIGACAVGLVVVVISALT